MFATRRLLHGCTITLFTRPNCGLCLEAHHVLAKMMEKRRFQLRTIDLSLPESQPWRQLYDFDIPVIHINKATADEEQVAEAGKAVKLMHRFTLEQVGAKMDEVENSL